MDGSPGKDSSSVGVVDAANQEPPRHALVDEAARVAAALSGKLPQLTDESPADVSGDQVARPRSTEDATRRAQTNASAPATMNPTTPREETGAAPPPRQATTAAAAMSARSGQRAASVGDNLRPRAERLREASSVVLDEASDDPGLRFVIIAVALFVIFLLFLLFSHILG